jgi:hypothetical protein
MRQRLFRKATTSAARTCLLAMMPPLFACCEQMNVARTLLRLRQTGLRQGSYTIHRQNGCHCRKQPHSPSISSGCSMSRTPPLWRQPFG